jgi:hypothetical protein
MRYKRVGGVPSSSSSRLIGSSRKRERERESNDSFRLQLYCSVVSVGMARGYLISSYEMIKVNEVNEMTMLNHLPSCLATTKQTSSHHHPHPHPLLHSLTHSSVSRSHHSLPSHSVAFLLITITLHVYIIHLTPHSTLLGRPYHVAVVGPPVPHSPPTPSQPH